MRTLNLLASVGLIAGLLVTTTADAGDWSNWRGPDRSGVSPETDLITSWSPEGENILWRADFIGRSTPVVIGGRACASGRTGEGEFRREIVTCFDAESGEKLWETWFNIYHTTVPWTRAGWANIAADPATGNIYFQGIGGQFAALDPEGNVIWERVLVEERGFWEGYGGRTQTPVIDGDQVIITFASSTWGDQTPPRHRLHSFDKLTGEEIWVSTPGGSLKDKNTQSTPAIATVGGRRILVQGNGDGGVYAVDANTGEKIWGYPLSKRGINTSVSVVGDTVYATHSEENVDDGTMGRIVALDATASGDLTTANERWRAPIGAGFSSAVIHDGRMYVVDNSANLHVLDAATGEHLWELNVGRVGKGSPVWADGKLYLTTVNGRFQVIEAGDTEGKVLSAGELWIEKEDRAPEIYSSVAISNGRLYFTTEEGFYCLGSKERPASSASSATMAAKAQPKGEGAPARLLVRPTEINAAPGSTNDFSVFAYDDLGRPLGEVDGVSWSLEGIEGELSGSSLSFSADGPGQAGKLVATKGELSAYARVRVPPAIPFSEDFEGVEIGADPAYLTGYPLSWSVADFEGSKTLSKPPSKIKIHRHITFFGSRDMAGYTIEADAYGSRTGRRVPDMGLINSGYKMELLGVHQKLQVRSWTSALRMMDQIDFAWDTDAWYTLKMRVDQQDDKAVIRGKVWPRGTDEPAEWTITVEDPQPIRSGSPGFAAYSPSTVYYDNLKVTRNES